jgi:hypothetical protein
MKKKKKKKKKEEEEEEEEEFRLTSDQSWRMHSKIFIGRSDTRPEEKRNSH